MDEEWRQLLRAHFSTSDSQALWEWLKQSLTVGQQVKGTVIAKAPFGVWVDIGVGFPALLLITDIEGLTPESYKANDWCPIGSAVSASIGIFNDSAFAIRICQKKLT